MKPSASTRERSKQTKQLDLEKQKAERQNKEKQSKKGVKPKVKKLIVIKEKDLQEYPICKMKWKDYVDMIVNGCNVSAYNGCTRDAQIKIHGRVSAAKKAVRHTSVIYRNR